MLSLCLICRDDADYGIRRDPQLRTDPGPYPRPGHAPAFVVPS